MLDQNVGSPEMCCLFDFEHFRSLFQKWIHHANKRIFLTIKGVRKNENGLVRKWRYQNIGSLEKFFLCDVEHFRSLFLQEWINQANKSIF